MYKVKQDNESKKGIRKLKKKKIWFLELCHGDIEEAQRAGSNISAFSKAKRKRVSDIAE